MNAKPKQIARGMISWLGKQKSWLLVFDGLDATEVASNIFPENGVMRHTIITTRNSDAKVYAAQGLEVPVLDKEEAIQLLSTVSGVSLPRESPSREQGEWIVKELGNLPLAVDHAAMYIRQVCGGLEAYINELENDRDTVYSWKPLDNKQYPHSVSSAGLKSLPTFEESPPAKQVLWKKFWRNSRSG